MINIDELDTRPLFPGDRRTLLLSGDGPFKVTNSCFVDTPPPAGFRPCAACNSTVVVTSGVPYYVVADEQFWAGKQGTLEISIVDATGDMQSIRMNVLADYRGKPTFAAAAGA